MIIETLLFAGAKALFGKAVVGGVAKVAVGSVAKALIINDVVNAIDSFSDATALSSGVDIHGNPPTDIHGNQPGNIHGNPPDGTIHGGKPTDIWGNPR